MIFRNRPSRNKNCLWQPCLLTDRDEIINFIEHLPYMFLTKFRFIWLSSFREENFLEIDQSETKIACGSHILMDRDEMSNLYRGPPIDASYQVSVYLATRFHKRIFFRNQPIRNKNSVAAMFFNGSGRNEQYL